MTSPIILASTSEIRRQLLSQARVPHRAMASRIDEDAMRRALDADDVSPRDQADTLAEMKARKIAEKNPEALVIGCDQILGFEGRIFAKPESKDELLTQLTALSGQTHRLFSAAVVYEHARPVWCHIGEVKLTMHVLSQRYIRGYISRNWETVRHCVGGYQLEAEGVRLFARIDGSYHAVLGLPLIELLSFLALRKAIEF